MTEDKPWLSLPDEEPPERGLAELMAAARVQADVMSRHTEAPAPWWKRMFEVLRRPPVLALATIIVLLGGVIVVGRHPDQVQSAAPAAPPVVQSPPAAAPPAPVDEEAAAPQMVAPPPVVAPSEPRTHVEKKPVAVKSEPRTFEKAATAHAATAHSATVKDEAGTSGIVKASADPKTSYESKASAGPKASDRESVQIAAPDPRAAIGGEDDAPLEQGIVNAGANEAPVEKVVADPLARCRAAAARKDCAGAKACAREVEKSDPTYYRANAGKDAALKSCL